LRALKAQIPEFDRRIMVWHRSNATSKRLDAIPGVGPALATALVASIAEPGAERRPQRNPARLPGRLDPAATAN
jgi:transposase